MDFITRWIVVTILLCALCLWSDGEQVHGNHIRDQQYYYHRDEDIENAQQEINKRSRAHELNFGTNDMLDQLNLTFIRGIDGKCQLYCRDVVQVRLFLIVFNMPVVANSKCLSAKH